MNLEEIKRRVDELLPDLCIKYGVQEIWVFGSYVRGEADEGSDLDLLVEIDNEELSLVDFIEIEIQLSEYLGIRVDLVEKKALKPAIGARVLLEAQLV